MKEVRRRKALHNIVVEAILLALILAWMITLSNMISVPIQDSKEASLELVDCIATDNSTNVTVS